MQSKNYIPRWVEDLCVRRGPDRQAHGLSGRPEAGWKDEAGQKLARRKRCSSLYFNWDDVSTRKAYVQDSRFFESPARSLGIRDPWIGFDEIHKRSRWRDILKGVYDVFGEEFRFLVTGSARLDLFRRAGDSLVGRYNLFHMMPFNIGEIVGLKKEPHFLAEKRRRGLSNLLKSGFQTRFLYP